MGRGIGLHWCSVFPAQLRHCPCPLIGTSAPGDSRLSCPVVSDARGFKKTRLPRKRPQSARPSTAARDVVAAGLMTATSHGPAAQWVRHSMRPQLSGV